MKNLYPTPIAGTNGAGISLQSVVNRLMCDSSYDDTVATVCNEVPAEVLIGIDEQKLSPVIHDLLVAVMMNARNGDVHITAEQFNNIVLLQIQDRNAYNAYAVACRLHCFASDAIRLGGHIDHKSKSQLISTVSFSFPARAAS
jgi:hypothetical protein